MARINKKRAPAAPRFVTLGAIAKLTKVSPTAVSLALRNHPKISLATRQRVQAMAQKLGYRLNPLVSAHMSYLRTLRPRYSGLVVAFVSNRTLEEIETNPRIAAYPYYRSAQARAFALGFSVQFFNVAEPGMSGRRLSDVLTARGIRGILLALVNEGAGVGEVSLDWDKFATVMIDHSLLDPGLHMVCNDEYSTIGRLIQRLLDYGHKRIGIAMHSSMDEHANHFWRAGYQTFQDLAKKRDRIPHFITPDWDRKRFLAWYARWKPEAIITINEQILRWLREAGVQIPGEVSCATLYWREDRPQLSGYYQNHELMASAAVDAVIAQLTRNEIGVPESSKTILIQAVWREGATVREKAEVPSDGPLRVWTR